MQADGKCEYIVLGYVSHHLQDEMMPVAVVGREIGPTNAAELRLHIAAVLGTIAGKSHLDYLHELFASWRETPVDRLDSLFSELRELSAGPVRTHSSGFCSITDFPKMVEQALGVHHELGSGSEIMRGRYPRGSTQ